MLKSWKRRHTEALALRDDRVLRLRLSVDSAKRYFAVEDLEELPLPQAVGNWKDEKSLKATGLFLAHRFRNPSGCFVAGLSFGFTDFTTECHDSHTHVEESDFRTSPVFCSASQKAFVQARCAEKETELLFRPLVERSGLSVLEPV